MRAVYYSTYEPKAEEYMSISEREPTMMVCSWFEAFYKKCQLSNVIFFFLKMLRICREFQYKCCRTNPGCPALFYSQLISGIWGFLCLVKRGKNSRLGGAKNVVTLSSHKKMTVMPDNDVDDD